MNMGRKRHPVRVVVVILVLATLACNASREEETPVPPSPTPPELAESSPTPSPLPPSPLPEATDTPVPDVDGPGGCSLNATYVADVTVPDDTEFAPDATFTKVWRVRNSGTCDWEAGTQLVYVSGDPLGGPVAVSVPAVAADSNTDISVDLVAPTDPGTYRSNWQLQSAEGERFGNKIYVRIIVPAPTEEPTEEPTDEPTEEPSPPDLVVASLEVDTDDPRQGIPMNIVATLRNEGGEVAEDVYWAWRVCVHAPSCEFVEAPDAVTLEPGEEVVAQMEYTFAGWSTYTTEAWVDSREEVGESDEENNTRQMTLPVKAGLPDLIISEIAYDPYPPVQDEDVTVEVSIHNQGSKNAGAFDIEWWASTGASQARCEWTLAGGLVAGGKAKVDCTYAYPSWYAKITTRAVADVNDSLDELDETNNALDMEISVSKP